MMNASSKLRTSALLTAGLLLGGCTGIPDGTQAVDDFVLDAYLGRWYEIARLDHSFERGMDCVTATYRPRDDGGISVVNRGVDLEEGKIETADGKAYFVEDRTRGRLKVSFFGPFYSGYNILELDPDYRYALVTGPNRDYLWILARAPRLAEATYQNLIARAQEMGFATQELIEVEQGQACQPYRE